MCGIIATINTDLAAGACPHLPTTLERLHHRGPDSSGTCAVALPWAQVTLGMARLKIVDQSDIVVPYHFPYLGVTLAYNGEVYNWRSLREGLSDGTPWMTSCDSEVIARAWKRWGPACLTAFNGMWSLVLVDSQKSSVFIARDRAGQKPLFYAQRGCRLYVASEAKALPVALTAVPCADMDAFEFDFGASTPISGVSRLPAGHCVYLDGHTSLDHVGQLTQRWWSLPAPQCPKYTGSYVDAVEELMDLVVDSVRLRTVAEVPVALQLSGGLDSAIIHQAVGWVAPSLLESMRAYCVDFTSEGINNLSTAQRVRDSVMAVGLTAAELQEILPKVVYHLDTPATWSACCLWKLAEQISGDGHKIILSGEGADELFGGYTRYRVLYWLQRMLTDPHLAGYEPTIQYAVGGLPTDILTRLLDRGPAAGSCQEHIEQLIGQHGLVAGQLLEPTRVAMRTEWATTMQVLLRMGDRMASAWALENRCPFLDYRIVELACSLPTDWLITPVENKHILRDVARALDVPAAICDEKSKKGLAIPWARWATQLGVETAGPRGAWDRSGFSALMQDNWTKHCLREATCTSCEPTQK